MMKAMNEEPNIEVAFDALLPQLKGASVSACFQCQKCSSGCPIAAEADIKPHELVRLAQLGAKQELLTSHFIWWCTSCGTCRTRCPQDVDLPSAIDALRRLSWEEDMVAERAVAAFNIIFLDSVEKLGRVHELALMASFKLKTRRFIRDMSKAPAMLLKGKFPFLPQVIPGSGDRQRLFRKAFGLEEKR
jgi:heterodisulfide reductase subunit C